MSKKRKPQKRGKLPSSPVGAPSKDSRYLNVILAPIRVSARYKPKFGQGTKGGGLTLEQFKTLYQSDPFYRWFGLDNPLMYAAHKAAGGMTSVYRQIGIGGEKLFRAVLQDSLGLTATDVQWSYQIPRTDGKMRKLSLDGRIPLERISGKAKRARVQNWMREASKLIDVDPQVFATLTGTVFEVRQGYKSKDSKRQNADIANAAAAYTKAQFPCVLLLSNQIDSDILLRYRAEKWAVMTGVMAQNNPLVSTYDFMRDVIGYDLAGFFQRNTDTLRSEIDAVLKTLLTPDAEQ